jgi:hypothetical protein
MATWIGMLFVIVCRAAERPNILFVLTEDQGAHLSLLGRERQADGLQKGVEFGQHF